MAKKPKMPDPPWTAVVECPECKCDVYIVFNHTSTRRKCPSIDCGAVISVARVRDQIIEYVARKRQSEEEKGR